MTCCCRGAIIFYSQPNFSILKIASVLADNYLFILGLYQEVCKDKVSFQQ